jgi:hypothetical protein
LYDLACPLPQGKPSAYGFQKGEYSMNFHLAHVVPEKVLHGLNGYKEVIDTIQWGLQQLGHSATYGLNTLSKTATNIIFGAHLLDMELLKTLPRGTVVYNLEQNRGMKPADLKPQLQLAAERFQIWDYSEGNNWEALGASRVCVVPIGYAPILQRIPRPQVQDIDVLIYGSTGKGRLGAFHHVARSGLTSVFLCGLYGSARDALIGRSKLILNINLYDYGKIFEVVRVSYLLANRKAVIADIDTDTLIDDDIRSAIRVASPSELVDECERLSSDDASRMALENIGFSVMEKRDIRPILRKALEAM